MRHPYYLRAWNRLVNRPFVRWRHFTTSTRHLFAFPFIFKFGNPSEVGKAKALFTQESKTLKDSGRSSEMTSTY